MIFLDTSAIYALASADDPNHGPAIRIFTALLERGETVVTHNYVLIEAFALLQTRLGMRPTLAFERDSHHFEIEWIDAETHEAAVARWASGKRNLSFVDQVSFLVMQRRRIDLAFAFDNDFKKAGFGLITE